MDKLRDVPLSRLYICCWIPRFDPCGSANTDVTADGVNLWMKVLSQNDVVTNPHAF